MIAFGPVPSRRLGRSLGINNIPPKTCTYSCIYCQLGRTMHLQAEPQSFFEPEEILREVRQKLDEARAASEPIDYLTFVSDGEPTLDLGLGRAIDLLRPLGVRIAVISNGSLAWREEVKGALLKADWLSLKVDAVREDTWRRIDRPHGSLSLPSIQDGMLALAAGYTGQLATETMLLDGVNDSERELEEVAALLARLQPRVAYLSVPIRPPAESRVRPPDEASLNRAFQILSQVLGVERVEYLIGYEGNAFAFTGDVERDLLSITAVHPMRQDAVEAFLARAQSGRRAETEWEIVQRLVAQNQLVATEYGGHRFYLRKLGGGSG